MKLTTKILAVTLLVYIGLFIFNACDKTPIERIPDKEDPENTNIPELIITNFNGGKVEWVSIQKGMSADAKVADAKSDRNDIFRSNDTLFIQLVSIENDTLPFTASGNYTVVLKHDQKDKMYIKLGVKFTNGLADLKWGGWLVW